MELILKTEWPVLDAADPSNVRHTTLPAGTHQVERIPNPCMNNGTFWLVLVGTKIGATEGSWRQWVNGGSLVTNPDHPEFGKPVDWGQHEVVSH
jgi:hypothetical protein